MNNPPRLIRGRIFDGVADRGPGSIEIADGLIVQLHYGPDAPAAGSAEVVDLGNQLITPGLVDVHSHGGGGAAFGLDPAPALALHRAHGTTTMIASLVSQSLDELERQLRMLTPLVAAGELAGVHLEGPWLAPGKKGAHPLEMLRAPEPADVVRLLDAAALPDGRGSAVKMVTLAPELDYGIEAVRLLAEHGVVAAIGHTDADLATTQAAIDAGATGATHLFNAMPPLHHRHPGPILGLAADERVWLELIVDGVHVQLDLVAETIKRYGDRVVLVTDAMAAAGQPDGDYMLGDLAVQVIDGVARLVDGGAIAGSTLILDAAVRNCIRAGVDWRQALKAATSLPARYLGLDAGQLLPGRSADLVVWDADWRPVRVLRHGQWLPTTDAAQSA